MASYSRIIKYNQEDYTLNLVYEILEDFIDDETPDYVKNCFWFPNNKILNILYDYCGRKNYSNVLEVGPGSVPFKLAQIFVGLNECIPKFINVDINKEKLPFLDKQFDFIYCRHVLEDIYNPEFALRQIIRTSNSCFIETPSPLIECMKYVDCESGNDVDTLRGYRHHRYLIWSNFEKNEIYFLPKYPLIEKIRIENNFLKILCKLANEYPVYWNNYILLDNTKKEPTIIMYDHPKDFNNETIQRAIFESIANTNYFVTSALNNN